LEFDVSLVLGAWMFSLALGCQRLIFHKTAMAQEAVLRPGLLFRVLRYYC
jgi:hypothetical protein